jgi:hypothetical protein
MVDEPVEVAREMVTGMEAVREWRRRSNDSYNYNWLLHIPPEFQLPFDVNHQNMRSLQLHSTQPPHVLAANLRRAFSGIVAGNVKDYGIRAIEEHGPFELHADLALVKELDNLLNSFVEQSRMKIVKGDYQPCYRLLA